MTLPTSAAGEVVHGTGGATSRQGTARTSQHADATVRISSAEWLFLLVAVVATVMGGLITAEWFGVVGISVSVVGLAIAIRQILMAQDQISQTLSVAEATRQAVTQTEDQIARQDLLRLVPDMQAAEKGLHSAAREEDVGQMAEHLAMWRTTSYQFIGLLEDRPYADDVLLTELHRTATMAASLIVEMPESGPQARVDTKQIRAAISAVCGRLGILESKLRLYTGQE